MITHMPYMMSLHVKPDSYDLMVSDILFTCVYTVMAMAIIDEV